jgi:hypothetical protein
MGRMAAEAQNTPKPLVYVSYAWGDDIEAGNGREQIVDELCEALEKYDGIKVGRDKSRQRIGDSIECFAAEIATADIMFAVVSKKYLRSYHCMVEELYQAFTRSNHRREEFGKRVCLLLLDDARSDIRDSQELIDYWIQFSQDQDSKLQQTDPGKTKSSHGRDSLGKINEMISRIIDMHTALTDSVMPRGYDQITLNEFQEVRVLIRRRLEEWRQWRDGRNGFIPEISDGSANESQSDVLNHQFLALVLERGKDLVEDANWFHKECPWEVRSYKWESLLFTPQNGGYLTVDLQADIGSYLVAEQALSTSFSTDTESSTFDDLLRAAVSWMNRQPAQYVLELFVPTELLVFDWAAIKIFGRSEYGDDECLFEQHPYVLRSLERFRDDNLASRLENMPLKYEALAAGNGRWISGDAAVDRMRLKESETKPEFVALKCVSHLDADPLNRLRWHRSVVEAMMPLALWWRGSDPCSVDERTSHLDDFYQGLLSGHNDADPVPKDCHQLEKLPRLRREAISEPLTKDFVLLLDRPDRHPWFQSNLPQGSSIHSV